MDPQASDGNPSKLRATPDAAITTSSSSPTNTASSNSTTTNNNTAVGKSDQPENAGRTGSQDESDDARTPSEPFQNKVLVNRVVVVVSNPFAQRLDTFVKGSKHRRLTGQIYSACHDEVGIPFKMISIEELKHDETWATFDFEDTPILFLALRGTHLLTPDMHTRLHTRQRHLNHLNIDNYLHIFSNIDGISPSEASNQISDHFGSELKYTLLNFTEQGEVKFPNECQFERSVASIIKPLAKEVRKIPWTHIFRRHVHGAQHSKDTNAVKKILHRAEKELIDDPTLCSPENVKKIFQIYRDHKCWLNITKFYERLGSNGFTAFNASLDQRYAVALYERNQSLGRFSFHAPSDAAQETIAVPAEPQAVDAASEGGEKQKVTAQQKTNAARLEDDEKIIKICNRLIAEHAQDNHVLKNAYSVLGKVYKRKFYLGNSTNTAHFQDEESRRAAVKAYRGVDHCDELLATKKGKREVYGKMNLVSLLMCSPEPHEIRQCKLLCKQLLDEKEKQKSSFFDYMNYMELTAIQYFNDETDDAIVSFADRFHDLVTKCDFSPWMARSGVGGLNFIIKFRQHQGFDVPREFIFARAFLNSCSASINMGLDVYRDYQVNVYLLHDAHKGIASMHTLRFSGNRDEHEFSLQKMDGLQLKLYRYQDIIRLQQIGELEKDNLVVTPQGRLLTIILRDGISLSVSFPSKKHVDLFQKIARMHGVVEEKSVRPASFLKLKYNVTTDLIGKGAFSNVYRAEDEMTGNVFALKIFARGRGANSIENETVNPNFRNNHVVKVHEFHPDNIVMEFIDGGSLKLLLTLYGPLSVTDTQFFTAQLVEGVAYLHDQRILHQDIKGDNLLIDSFSGQLKVTDFNIASKVMDDFFRFKGRGTLGFMAPEVIEERSGVSEPFKADVWAIGCCVVEMLSGKSPTSEDLRVPSSHKGTKTTHAVENLPGVDQSWDEEARSFIRACVKENPDERPRSQELKNHLFIKGHVAEIHKRKASEWSRLAQTRRNERRAILILQRCLVHDKETFVNEWHRVLVEKTAIRQLPTKESMALVQLLVEHLVVLIDDKISHGGFIGVGDGNLKDQVPDLLSSSINPRNLKPLLSYDNPDMLTLYAPLVAYEKKYVFILRRLLHRTISSSNPVKPQLFLEVYRWLKAVELHSLKFISKEIDHSPAKHLIRPVIAGGDEDEDDDDEDENEDEDEDDDSRRSDRNTDALAHGNDAPGTLPGVDEEDALVLRQFSGPTSGVPSTPTAKRQQDASERLSGGGENELKRPKLQTGQTSHQSIPPPAWLQEIKEHVKLVVEEAVREYVIPALHESHEAILTKALRRTRERDTRPGADNE